MSGNQSHKTRYVTGASLSIMSKELSVAELVEILGIEPDRSETTTHNPKTGKRLKHPIAFITLSNHKHGYCESLVGLSSNLRECLGNFLDRIEPLKPNLEKIRDQISASLAISFSSDMPVNMATLSPALMARVADLNAMILISTPPLSEG